ncbi:oligosaccharide flippase family protein [Chryseobacterium hagamense]|uniref:Teichoic acid transporter n=1 Tax=Chryseobacterium hagamense TaxID=395935 RepID=A0A511YLU4_9FLAO|nr:oligosaccharide flippase family protein [Chryseobacterium hagamense]GEN76169.1 teichoic acid transporter [Chryseobacterium hagamense]
MLLKIKDVLRGNKKIIENFSFLTFVQIFTLISPLLTYPYLIRIVGLELYGVIVFAQSIVGYISLFVNFGFGTSGPRDVAILKENHEKLSEYVSSVFILKFIFWIICFLVYFLTITLVPYFQDHLLIYYITFFISLGDLFFPIWFFQGIEKMKYITFINIIVKIIFVIGVFIFVKEQFDYINIVILNFLGALISGLLGCIMVFRYEKIKFIIVSREILAKEFKTNSSLFISTVSIQLYMNFNKMIIGSFLGMKEIAIYDLGEKIVTLLKTPLFMFNQAVFPKISREKSIQFINKSMLLVLGFIILIYLNVFIFSEEIVQFFIGKINQEAIIITRILGVSLVFMTISMFLGGLRLIPFGYNKEYMKAMLFNGIVYCVIISILYIFKSINLYSLTIGYVLVEILCCIYLFFVNKKLRLL